MAMPFWLKSSPLVIKLSKNSEFPSGHGFFEPSGEVSRARLPPFLLWERMLLMGRTTCCWTWQQLRPRRPKSNLSLWVIPPSARRLWQTNSWRWRRWCRSWGWSRSLVGVWQLMAPKPRQVLFHRLDRTPLRPFGLARRKRWPSGWTRARAPSRLKDGSPCCRLYRLVMGDQRHPPELAVASPGNLDLDHAVRPHSCGQQLKDVRELPERLQGQSDSVRHTQHGIASALWCPAHFVPVGPEQ